MKKKGKEVLIFFCSIYEFVDRLWWEIRKYLGLYLLSRCIGWYYVLI